MRDFIARYVVAFVIQSYILSSRQLTIFDRKVSRLRNFMYTQNGGSVILISDFRISFVVKFLKFFKRVDWSGQKDSRVSRDFLFCSQLICLKNFKKTDETLF